MVINTIYLQEKSIEELQKSFQENEDFPAVILFSFLDNNYWNKIQKEIINLPFNQEKEPLTNSYATAPLPISLQKFLQSEELLQFLSLLFKKEVKEVPAKIYRFSWKDYIILHDEKKEETGLDLFIDFTEEWNEEAGGNIFYNDGTGEYLQISIMKNACVIAERKEGISKFIKYVNVLAREQKRYFLLGKIILKNPENS